MIDYGYVHSTTRPSEIEMTNSQVFLATDIHEYATFDIQGYEYNLKAYNKDEYLLLLAEKNAQLEEELQATKILLGVE